MQPRFEKRIRETLDKHKRQVLNGERTFRLDSEQCSYYLNVENETFHRPVCKVLSVDLTSKTARIKATFYGSGIFSYPIKYGKMPLAEIQPEYPWLLHIWYSWFGKFLK